MRTLGAEIAAGDARVITHRDEWNALVLGMARARFRPGRAGRQAP